MLNKWLAKESIEKQPIQPDNTHKSSTWKAIPLQTFISIKRYPQNLLLRLWFCKSGPRSTNHYLKYELTRELQIVFFAFESNLESNGPSHSISNRIFESAVYTTQAVTLSNELQGAPCRRTMWAYMLFTLYSEYLILNNSIVFVTNESDAHNWVLVTHFNSVLKRVKLCRCTII